MASHLVRTPAKLSRSPGASGSGKSTLLHLLGGLETADHGTITLNGTDGRRRQIGFVFQFHYLLSDLSAVENVALPLLIARHNSRQAHERALGLLKEAGLEARADHPVSHLSGGEQQRVAVARALVTEPKLLLADEPTGNLDAAISEEIARTLVTYAHKHSAILIIATHSATLAECAIVHLFWNTDASCSEMTALICGIYL